MSYPLLCGRVVRSDQRGGTKARAMNQRQFITVLLVLALLGCTGSVVTVVVPKFFLEGEENWVGNAGLGWVFEILTQATTVGAVVLPVLLVYILHRKNQSGRPWQFTPAGRAKERNKAGMDRFNQG